MDEPIVLGGLGEMNFNSGTQFYQQDRVYSSDGFALCHPANIPGGSYRYLVVEDDCICNTISTILKDTTILEIDDDLAE